MGWAIRTADGSYRAWNANAQDDPLRPGEVWEAWDHSPIPDAPPASSPLITALDLLLSIPNPTIPQIIAVLRLWRKEMK